MKIYFYSISPNVFIHFVILKQMMNQYHPHLSMISINV